MKSEWLSPQNIISQLGSNTFLLRLFPLLTFSSSDNCLSLSPPNYDKSTSLLSEILYGGGNLLAISSSQSRPQNQG